MAKWLARIAFGIEFDAVDANEAVAVAENIRTAETFLGHRIVGRSEVWVADIPQDASQERNPE